jgi:hypothetical protein
MGGFSTPKKVMISQVEIDADKVWEDILGTPHGISRLKEVVLGMIKGDLAVRGNTVLQRLAAGPISFILTSAGEGHIPVWMPAAGALDRYLAAQIELSHAEGVVTPDQTIANNAPLTSEHKEAYGDAPADMIKLLSPAVALADAESVLSGPDVSIPTTVSPQSALSILCDGFVEETAAAVQTDKTAQARDAVANDLNLNPMTPLIGDKIYIGSNYPFWQAQVMVGTQGVGNWTNSWSYWNGAWVPVVGEIDGSNEWQFGTGLACISHTPQGDWVQCVIQGMNLYWLKSETIGFVNQITAPLGTQVWVAIA